MRSSWKAATTRFLSVVFVSTALVVPMTAQQPGPTAEQASKQAELNAKLASADTVVSRDEVALGRTFDAQIRDRIIKALATTKSHTEILATPVGDSVTTLAVGIGDTTANLVYFPVAPCRVIDTRFIGPAPGAPIIPGANRNFSVLGGPFTLQGGSATTCNAPFPGPAAAMLNFVAVGPTAVGDLRVFPFGVPVPNASAINYIPGNNVANGLVQSTCQGAGCTFDITIQADSAPTHLVVDILGYFMFPSTPVTQHLWAAVSPFGPLAPGQNFRATSASAIGAGLFEVVFDRNITNCNYTATIGDAGVGTSVPGFVTVTQRAGNPNALSVGTYNAAAVATNRGFMVHVNCPAAPASP